jgi:hypothetical protein
MGYLPGWRHDSELMRKLGWVNSKQWVADARVLVLARRCVVATAGSEGDLPQFEIFSALVNLILEPG